MMFWKRIVCILFFKEHIWSGWCSWVTGDKDYRYCSRCGKQEFRG